MIAVSAHGRPNMFALFISLLYNIYHLKTFTFYIKLEHPDFLKFQNPYYHTEGGKSNAQNCAGSAE